MDGQMFVQIFGQVVDQGENTVLQVLRGGTNTVLQVPRELFIIVFIFMCSCWEGLFRSSRA